VFAFVLIFIQKWKERHMRVWENEDGIPPDGGGSGGGGGGPDKK
jgi:hypothetical protein